MSLADRRTKQMETVMFKAVNEQLPEYISERFQKTNTIHRQELTSRSMQLHYIPVTAFS